MPKLVIFLCLLAGSGKDYLKPDLVTIDGVAGEAGSVYSTFYPFSPKMEPGFFGLSANAGRLHLYWGDRISFLAGMELVDAAMLTGYWVSLELLTPRVGIARLGNPKSTERSLSGYCCLATFEKQTTFYPRLELVSGVNFISLLYGEFVPSIRTDLRWQPVNGFFIQFQDYWYPTIDKGAHALFLSAGLNAGVCIQPGGEKKEREE